MMTDLTELRPGWITRTGPVLADHLVPPLLPHQDQPLPGPTWPLVEQLVALPVHRPPHLVLAQAVLLLGCQGVTISQGQGPASRGIHNLERENNLYMECYI